MIANRFNCRAWHKDEKRMFYDLNLFGVGAETDMEVEECIDEQNGYDFQMYDLNEVILLQSTGLTDKNGKEIFEGDIIRYKTADMDVIRTIRYDEYEARLVASQLKSIHDYCNFNRDWISKYEVIGNLYENKELLGIENE